METYRVRTAAEAEEAVRTALAKGQALDIVGHGTKRAIGGSVQADAVLDVSGLDRITLYEPEELVLTVEAGAPLAEVVRLLTTRNQELAFEPMDLSSLLGGGNGQGTVGGMLSVAMAGPRRIKVGGARDHFLGAAAVSGYGEAFKSGGRVVKNVTGYDLCKLLAGSWGTLAVMTEVTLKVLPRAETTQTLVLSGLTDGDGVAALTAGLAAPCEVSGAAHLPAAAARGLPGGLDDGRAKTLLRLEGIAASCRARADMLRSALTSFGRVEQVEDDETGGLWEGIRDAVPFAVRGPQGNAVVWRIIGPPASGGRLGMALAEATGGLVFYDWGGGLIWLAMPAGDAQAATVRRVATAFDAHAMLIRADSATRQRVAIFPPMAAGIATLNRAIKAKLDPHTLLGRGRMPIEALS